MNSYHLSEGQKGGDIQMDILVTLYFLLQSWVVVSLTNFTCHFPGILFHSNRETPSFSLPTALTLSAEVT